MAVSILVSMLLSGCGSVPRKAWMAPIEYNIYLQNQGAFVAYPTMAGYIVGMPAMIISVPLMPFLEPETGEGSGWGMLLLGPSLVGDITGTPFLVLRRAIWDYPKWAFAPNADEPSTNSDLNLPITKPAEPQR